VLIRAAHRLGRDRLDINQLIGRSHKPLPTVSLVNTWLVVYTHAHNHTCMHTHIHTRMHAHTHTHARAHTHSGARRHALIHTHY